MTYIAGGNVQATDYNTFATSAASVNEVFADLHPGSTTIAAGANYGYGQSPALASVSIGTNVLATEWASLFSAIRACGQHQDNSYPTGYVPPVPAAGPVTNDTITAFTAPATIASVISTLRTNRHNLATSQTALIPGTTYTGVGTWTTLLTYSFQANFGSWNNARYFFNSGGSLQIVGSYTTASSPVELAWRDAISTPTAPFSFKWGSTDAATGSNDAPLAPIGFWRPASGDSLTTGYQVVYSKNIGSGYYIGSFVQIEVKLNAAAGTNGLVDFRVSLNDFDSTPDLKAAGVAFQVNNIRSSGSIVYPGPAVIITDGGFTYV